MSFLAATVELEQLCCNEDQMLLLANYFLYMLTCFVLWRSRVLLPLKLLTVFLHEFSHAIGVWMSCGRVQGIEVHADQGGLTHWSARADRMRCAKHCVLPAGYLGSAAWGGFLLVCSATPSAARAAALALLVALLVALCYALFGRADERDWVLPVLCVAMIVVLGGLLFVSFATDWSLRQLLLAKTLLLIAVMNTLFATWDIWEDTVRRSVERSDACKYAEHVGCAPRCIGCIWLIASLVIAACSLAAAVVLSWQQNPVPFSGFSSAAASLLFPSGILLVAVLHRRLCSRTYAAAEPLNP